jgi:signal transduction histidine kinase/ActR/RegA family two-component response regulator
MTQLKETSVLKNIPQRISQMGLMAFGVSVGITVYYYFLGLYTSCIMVASFSVSAAAILILQYFKILKQAQIFILGAICSMLVVSGFIEGSVTGQYFYFFAVIVVIPVIVDYKNSSNLEFGLTYAAVIVSFGICFYIGQTHKPFEQIPPAIAHQMLFTNAGSAIMLTLCFSVAYIHYEKKHLKAIVTEKNNAIAVRTRFLSTMGHELRTPLNGIIGALNLIHDEHPQFAENEYFPVIKYCSNHMQQLINDILDFNKLEADKLSIHPIDVNLKQLLANSTLPFYNHIEEKNLQLIVDIDPLLDNTVLVDDVRLIQVLNNLLSNAMKFTEQGYIKLVAKCQRIDEGSMSVGFTLADTGIGIGKEDHDKIFETFGQVFNESSRKYNGTGLGLTICLRLLKLMGSELKLESESQKGSTFSFDLELQRPAKQLKNSGTTRSDSDDLSGIRILLVEDNQINMMIAKKMLTGKNAACGCAYNGQEALNMLSEDALYDIVLLDLEMPVMDGYTAIKELKRLYPTLPIVALTASLIDAPLVAALLESGFSDCILKPFQPQHLFSKIKQFAGNQETIKYQS